MYQLKSRLFRDSERLVIPFECSSLYIDKDADTGKFIIRLMGPGDSDYPITYQGLLFDTREEARELIATKIVPNIVSSYIKEVIKEFESLPDKIATMEKALEEMRSGVEVVCED